MFLKQTSQGRGEKEKKQCLDFKIEVGTSSFTALLLSGSLLSQALACQHKTPELKEPICLLLLVLS